MTVRMQKYRDKKQQQGLVQVRVWIPQEHELFIISPVKLRRSGRRYKGVTAVCSGFQYTFLAHPVTHPHKNQQNSLATIIHLSSSVCV